MEEQEKRIVNLFILLCLVLVLFSEIAWSKEQELDFK